jgi:anti-sigma B factor antagonist
VRGEALATHVSRTGTTVTVALTGELDVATAAALRARLLTLAASEPAPAHVVLDLRDLAFVDASGISVLLAAQRSLAARGATLVLRRPSRPVRRVLALLDLERVLAIES